jgi:hypothetical protein
MWPFLSENNRHRNGLAAAFRENQIALSQALFTAVREKARTSWKVPQQFEQVKEIGSHAPSDRGRSLDGVV